MLNDMASFHDLRDKTVVVTGAGEGIGKAIAKAFIEQGSKVILISRNGIKWAKEVCSDNCIVLEKDIRDVEYFEGWLSEYESSGNRIDILVNNAGIIHKKKMMESTEQEWDEIISINSKATFFLTKLFALHMIESRKGNIIFSGSFANRIPSYSYGLYAASKSMTASLAKSLAAELAPYNIRVNSFSPGVIKTKMTEAAIAANESKMLNDISLSRFGDSSEVANAVLFLASEVSSYITGIDLDISGGKFIIQNPGQSRNVT